MSKMLARDYTQLGTEKSILCRIGNGSGFPFKGPLNIRFIDGQTLAVIEKEKGISFVNMGVVGGGKPGALRLSADTATGLRETNEADSISFLKASAVDVCRVPLSKNIAICDTSLNTINFIDNKEWFQKKAMPGRFMGLTGMACFSIGFEVYFVICSSFDKTVTIAKEGGQVMAVTSGDHSNTLEEPTGVSIYTGSADLSEAIPTPPWYVGECSAQDLRRMLPKSAEPGSFLVGKDSDIKIPKTFNIAYVDSIWQCEMATIASTENGGYILGSKDASLVQDSVWDIIRKWDMLIQVRCINHLLINDILMSL